MPSYSQGRKKHHFDKERSKSKKNRGGKLVMSSTSNVGFNFDRKRSLSKKKVQKVAKQKNFHGMSSMGFKHMRGSVKRDDHSFNTETAEKPTKKRKYADNTADSRRTKNNFKMFRINEESEYSYRQPKKIRNKTKKSRNAGKGTVHYLPNPKEEDQYMQGCFLPRIGGNFIPTKRGQRGSSGTGLYSRSVHYSKGNLLQDGKPAHHANVGAYK